MFIESLKVSYPSEGWTLEETRFDRLNLLVGASGVGKTRILEAIETVGRLALVADALDWVPSRDMVWAVGFQSEGQSFLWQGEVGPRGKGPSVGGDEATELYFVQEAIYKAGQEVASRQNGDAWYMAQKMPKLNARQSLFSVYGYDEGLLDGLRGWKRLIHADGAVLESVSLGTRHDSTDYAGFTLEQLRDASIPLTMKMLIASTSPSLRPRFDAIVERFRDIFPFVETVGISLEYPNGSPLADVFIRESWQVGGKRIHSAAISSGMKKTLAFLAQMEFCPDQSVLMVDEFENSLGVNCIGAVVDEVQVNLGRLQFILTSHHPYVINNVDFQYWKVITRKDGLVTARPALEYGLGRSKHERFFQLINLEDFQTGGLEVA